MLNQISQGDIKRQAKILAKFLGEEGVQLGHSKALEALARCYGYRDWRTAQASLPIESKQIEDGAIKMITALTLALLRREHLAEADVIYALDPNGDRRILWKTLKLPAFMGEGVEATLRSEITLPTNSLQESDLAAPVERIRELGGGRGIFYEKE